MDIKELGALGKAGGRCSGAWPVIPLAARRWIHMSATEMTSGVEADGAIRSYRSSRVAGCGSQNFSWGCAAPS